MAESSTAPQTVDQWLETQGFRRSENNTENNSLSLFKVVAAQQYSKLGLLYSYGIVKTDCVRYMAENQQLFDQDLDVSFDDYQKKWYIDNDWPGQRQIEAMSLLYKKDFIVYDAMNKERKLVTNNGYDKYFYLLQSTPNHYEMIEPINLVKHEGGDQQCSQQMGTAIVNVSLNTLLRVPTHQGDVETAITEDEMVEMADENPVENLRMDY